MPTSLTLRTGSGTDDHSSTSCVEGVLDKAQQEVYLLMGNILIQYFCPKRKAEGFSPTNDGCCSHSSQAGLTPPRGPEVSSRSSRLLGFLLLLFHSSVVGFPLCSQFVCLHRNTTPDPQSGLSPHTKSCSNLRPTELFFTKGWR